MRLSDFDYKLPADRIAQQPKPRGASRMLLVNRRAGQSEDRAFSELVEILRGDEVLVVNNARVLPARLVGQRVGVHAQPIGRKSRARGEFLQAPIEVLLLRRPDPTTAPDEWEALVKPGRKMRNGERVTFGEKELEAEVLGRGEFGLRRVRLHVRGGTGNSLAAIERLGHMPLPPYIDRGDEAADRENYQTIFARETCAAAAPTAGLHFTREIVQRLRMRGVETVEITLHVGLGTFQPIRTARLEEHRMHAERYEISDAAARAITTARRERRPVVAVGTTVVRALEDAAQRAALTGGEIRPVQQEAEIFIRPGHKFRVVDEMLTNFHLPKSTLLVMVAAFAGRELILRAYEHAIACGYRFYSYGDCMLIQ